MTIPRVKALMPMKEHSERVPEKNFRLLNGKPAFFWALENLMESEYIDEVIINTDSQKIADMAKSNFDVTILERPNSLLGDHVSIQPLIAYDLSKSDGEYFIQTHSTNPLVRPSTYDKAIETFFNQTEHDALFSVTEVKQRFYWPDMSAINHDPQKLIRTQDLEPIFHENSCFYIFSKQSNIKTQSRLGSKPMMFPIERLEAGDIDDLEDFYWVEYILKSGLMK